MAAQADVLTGAGADASADAAQTACADWYKDAVLYELHVRAYADGNGDGIGDFPGLLGHLDHLQQLGADTIWLLPFYPSPMRDDGYDVADHTAVHPSYGTLRDFQAVVEEAHRRGMRVMTELVLNHTSDVHPWFQRARRAARGSVHRDFYVWSDDDRRYAGTRVIFQEAERSNWAWDPVAGQFYWHRFFSHQPDLNFDNPAVVDAIAEVMTFWRELGVDGFRLDAVPYLVERDGTCNENLPQTHEVIRELRRRMDRHRPGGVFLAEANLWPEDVRDYFGDGDECHMAFHFPLMPRMYMAIAQEDRHPVSEILAQTPALPAEGQWAIFLRNHDELTLESVTSRERDYMVQMYAADARARLNLGIRRRLAPLLDNDRPRIELMNALLLSLPGTPVLYYGDEIGMGDNLFLGDRHGVRTPMQWSRDRNGGFSRADPQALYLPAIQDPVYGYEAVNVEAQWREPSSLLNWTRRALAVRAATPALRRGRHRALAPGNRKVLAWMRETDDEAVLCVANLARAAQAVELDLQPWRGRVPVELFGRHAFPPIGDLPYLLTLPGHGFFWFRLCPHTDPPAWHIERLPVPDLPLLVLFDGWKTLFPGQVAPWRLTMAQRLREQFETEVLCGHLRRQGWYQGVEPARVELVDHALLGGPVGPGGAGDLPAGTWMVAMARVRVPAEDGRADTGGSSPAADPVTANGPGASPVLLSLALALGEEPDPRAAALAPAA
ncbi:MAG: maltose alpha-D-glucosyltransferase, partial [Rubrivivax sp.]